MFKINDEVVYGIHGVCRIENIEVKEISGVSKEYYVLKPAKDSAATIYVPINSKKLVGKMRKLLTEQDVYQLIEKMPQKEIIWYQNENERKEEFKKVIERGDHSELIGMIKAIYLQKQERESIGRHLHISDERFFKEAENLLYNELQYVLDMEKEELLSLIFSKVKETN